MSHSQLSTIHSPLIKEGYKQTEVGVIPEDWEVVPLGGLAKISAGGTPSRSCQAYWGGDIPWITTTEVNGGDICHANQFITKKGLDNSATKYLPEGTLLLALYGQGKTRGKVGVLSFKATINQACAAIQINRKISNRFVFYYLSYQYAAIRELSNSGSQDNLNSSIVKSILLPLPPTLAEQEAIVEALSDADSLIESLQQLIDKKRLIKQGAMQMLLSPWETENLQIENGELRMENDSSAKNPQLKKGWVEKTLGEVCHIDPSNLSSNTPLDYTFKYVSLENVQPERLTGWTDVTFATAPSRARRKLQKNDVLISTVRPNLLAHCIIKNHVTNLVGSTGFAVLRADRNIGDPNFLLAQFFHSHINNQIEALVAGSNYPAISSRDVRNLKIFTPPTLPEQTRIATILSDMDEEISTFETKLTKAKKIKQGMMSELLTGKIRLI